MPTSRPQFLHPPVTEVALAAYFNPAVDFQAVHVGSFHDRWREDFPQSRDEPLLPPVPAERFDGPALGLSIHVGAAPGVRTIFSSSRGDRVIQLQPDRLVLNWRFMAEGDEYPRYGTLRPQFARILDEFEAACAEVGILPPQVSHSEISYTNVIPRRDPPLTAADVLVPWSPTSPGEVPAEEDVQTNLRYRIADPDTGASAGRLFVTFSPAMLPVPGTVNLKDAFLFQLFARGTASSHGTSGALAFIDTAHDRLIATFAALTEPRMHTLWGATTDEEAG